MFSCLYSNSLFTSLLQFSDVWLEAEVEIYPPFLPHTLPPVKRKH